MKTVNRDMNGGFAGIKAKGRGDTTRKEACYLLFEARIILDGLLSRYDLLMIINEPGLIGPKREIVLPQRE